MTFVLNLLCVISESFFKRVSRHFDINFGIIFVSETSALYAKLFVRHVFLTGHLSGFLQLHVFVSWYFSSCRYVSLARICCA